MAPGRLALPVSLASAALVAAGCGAQAPPLPPAAEPARSPLLDRAPAGRVVPVGHKPEGLAVDERTGIVAVGLTNPDRLALVDARTLRVIRRVRLPESPRHLALARPGGPVLVPAERANALVEVTLPGGGVRTTTVGDTPHDAAAVGRRVFVGDELGHTLSVIENGRRIARRPVPRQPGGVVASPDGRRVAVVGVKERALELFETRTLRSLGKIPVGIGPTHVVAEPGRFFVVDTRGDALLEVRSDPLRIRRRRSLPGAPYGIAVDSPRGRLWVTLTESNTVARLPGAFRVPTVRQPNSVAVDERTGRVFVASRADGTLQAFDPAG